MSFTKEVYSEPKAWTGLRTLLTAADDDKIVTVANAKVGAYTIAAQPTAPSKLGVKVTAVGAADTQGIITVIGEDINRRTVTEVIVPIAGSTVYTNTYFMSVTSITGSGWVISEGNDTLIIGVLASAGIEVRGRNLDLKIVSGNVWINPKTTAVADATSIPLVLGEVYSLTVPDSLSLISDITGATFHAIIWD